MARIKSPEMPGFIKPQLPTLKGEAPSGDQCLREIKFDGYRAQIHLKGRPTPATGWTGRNAFH
jgi:bifunctional non-homologous end joining protein LigD